MIPGKNCSVDIAECASAPCFNGGLCSELEPNMYMCTCPPGVSGTNCELVIYATFGGNKGLQVLPDVVTYRTEIVVSFKMKTTVDSGLILCLSGVGIDDCFAYMRTLYVSVVLMLVGFCEMFFISNMDNELNSWLLPFD